jgi:hypothetical protein
MRVCIIDDTQRKLWSQKGLSHFWRLGSFLGGFDHVLPVRGVLDALVALDRLPTGPLEHLQIWGHGQSGRPLIGREVLDVEELASVSSMRASSVVWFRACDTFQGPRGWDFAIQAAALLGCSVVGHTRVISWPWVTHQSGGYALRPGELPHWSSHDDGMSGPGVPNTCLVTAMNPPESWWQAGGRRAA